MSKKHPSMSRSKASETSPIISIKRDLKLFCNPPNPFTQSLRRPKPMGPPTNFDRRNSCPGVGKSKTLGRLHPKQREDQRRPQTLPRHVFTRSQTVPASSNFRQRRQRSLFRDFKFPRSATVSNAQARTWRPPRFTNTLNDRAKLVSWEIVSGIDAVRECGVSIGSNCCHAGVRAVESTSSFCQQTTKMADTKIQDLKRSISSWSLSTFKKPKISGSKKLKFNVFGNKAKDRQAADKPLKTRNKTRSDKNHNQDELPEISRLADCQEQDEMTEDRTTQNDQSTSQTEKEPISWSPQKIHSKSAKLEDIKYIDDNTEESPTYFSKNCPALVAPAQYQDDDFSWHSSPSVKKDVHKEVNLEVDSNKKRDTSPTKSSADYPNWDVLPKSSGFATSTRSCSELQLNNVGIKTKTKDEIVLNTAEEKPKPKETRKKSFLNIFRRDKNIDPKDDDSMSSNSDTSRTDSFRRIFGIRRKLSMKPIVERDEVKLKNEELQIASTPIALADASRDWVVKKHCEKTGTDKNSQTEIILTQIKPAKISSDSVDHTNERLDDDLIISRSCQTNPPESGTSHKQGPLEFITRTLRSIRDNVTPPPSKCQKEREILDASIASEAKIPRISPSPSYHHSRQSSTSFEPRKISDVKEAAINATINNAMQVNSAKLTEEAYLMANMYAKLNKDDTNAQSSPVSEDMGSNNPIMTETEKAQMNHVNEDYLTNQKCEVSMGASQMTHNSVKITTENWEGAEAHDYQNVMFGTSEPQVIEAIQRDQQLISNKPKENYDDSLRKQLQSNIRPSTLGLQQGMRPLPSPRNKTNRYSCDESMITKELISPSMPYGISRNEEEPVSLPQNSIKIVRYDSKSSREPTKNKSEPIYWEIGSALSVPRPSPRKKKTQSMRELPVKSVSTLNLPRWIQQRPPMPSPRMKKQSSTQSLHSHQPEQSNTVSSHPHMFGNSFVNMNFNQSDNCLKEEWYGEDFYSGKAASVSYGMSSGSQQPPVPLRSKKPSLISLPAAIFSGSDPSQAVSSNQKNSRVTVQTTQLKKPRRKTAPVPPLVDKALIESSLTIVKDQFQSFSDFIHAMESNPQKPDELLSEVLYSVHSLIGPDSGNGSWIVPTQDATVSTDVVVDQSSIASYLKEIFQASDDKYMELWDHAQQKEPAAVTLFVKVVQAKGLRAKTVRGASNPYVIVSLPNSRESHRSKLEHETLNPTWNQEFSMQVKQLQREYLNIEVWHEFHPVDAEQVTAVRNIRGLTRLVKETNATFAHKQDAHLLGSVRIPLSELRQGTYSKWLDLQKDGSKDSQKPRGSIFIQINVGQLSGTSASVNRQSLDALLGKIVYHHIQNSTNNNQDEGSMQLPWRGQLSPEAKAIFAQHSIVKGLNESHQNLSWWIVGSRLPSSDTEWLYSRLNLLQQAMELNEYGRTELETIGESLFLWVRVAMQKLRSIQTSFPSASGIIARHQLAYLLKIIMSTYEKEYCRNLLEKRSVPDVRVQAKEAVIEHAKIWWTNLLDEQLKGVRDIDEQFSKVVHISNETFYFLSNVAVFYSPVLLTEASIPFFRESYLLLTQQLNHCVRPLLINVFSKDADNGNKEMQKQFTLNAGSVLWQLYSNLGRIYQLGQELPLDVREKSGLFDYHRWFTPGILRFLEDSRRRAEDMIEKAVQLDNFEPIDMFCNFSSSATDVTGIFMEVRIWWKNLSWPDPTNSGILLIKILEDVCSCGIIYSDLLKNKVEKLYVSENTSHNQIISKPICTGLNNIDRVRLELTSLPRQFGVAELSDKIEASSMGGAGAASSFNSNITNLIENSSINMETKVVEFIETVIERMLPALHNSVQKSCDDRSEEDLLVVVLDPSIQILKEKLNENNFICFLRKLWETLLTIFASVVNQNTTRRKASYFTAVCDILEKSSKFFSPSIGIGLTREEAQNEVYLSLCQSLEFLSLSSESLISKYYLERRDEQNSLAVTSHGELVVRAFFTKIGKLVVEVIMAKNMVLTNDSGSGSVLSNGQGQTTIVDSYVKMQIVPAEWFPHIIEKKTKTLRKSDPAVYEETFEFDLGQNDNGVSDGWILFTVKDFNIGRSNTFIGEAVLALNDLECVDSALKHTVKNSYLKMTMPGVEAGYESLTTLKLRPSDKVATNFVKRVGNRFAESRGRRIHMYSSDEDKPRSSNILNRRKISKS